MSTKPTPGPWTLERPCGFPYSGLYVVPKNTKDIKDFPFHIAQIRELRGDRGESEANANLIAAAPDMLAALKAWEEWYSVDSTEQKRDDARAAGLRAIAKADGKT